jgi:two-component system response regulator FlrC
LLDEITEMPLGLQAKLLRVLQEREVERVGGKQPVSPRYPRHRHLQSRHRRRRGQGLFREDLFYRLNVFPLLIPALRQRSQDIAPLARHFLATHGGSPVVRVCACPLLPNCGLQQHAWPGNVRELENVIQRAVILAPATSSTSMPCIWRSSVRWLRGWASGRKWPRRQRPRRVSSRALGSATR